MTDDERAMYSATVALRNNEVTLRWTRTQVFFLIHSAALSFVVSQLKRGELSHIGACVTGIFLAVLWFMLTKRVRHWIDYWDDRLNKLESKTSPPQKIRIFGGRSHTKVTKGFTAHAILVSLGLVFLMMWSALFIASIQTTYRIIPPP